MALPGPAIAVAQQRVVDAEILDDRQFAVAVIPVIGRFSVAEHPIADAVFIGLGEQIHIVENEALDLEVAAENGKERHLGLDMAEFEHFWARSPGGVSNVTSSAVSDGLNEIERSKLPAMVSSRPVFSLTLRAMISLNLLAS